MTESELVARIADGDEAAFLVVYERYGEAIYRVAYRVLGDVGLAQDIRHECFMTLVRQPERFDHRRASLRTFLLAITRNLSLGARRRQVRTPAVDVNHDTIPDHDTIDPLRRLLGNEARERLRTAVSNLPLLQREALVLVDYEGLPLAEAAAIVGADPGTLKARLHRGRAALRRAFVRDNVQSGGLRRWGHT
jgi:RNA polymerase sigma-70 factor (ECF subfamily)